MKKLLTVLAIIIIVGLLGVGGWYLVDQKNNKSNDEVSSSSATKSENSLSKSDDGNLSLDLDDITTSSRAKTDYNLTISDNGNTISYNGKTGFSALEILQKITQVKTKESSLGTQIIAINGLEQTNNKFWTYTVDGKVGNIGAADYQTKDGEIIEWKLSSF